MRQSQRAVRMDSVADSESLRRRSDDLWNGVHRTSDPEHHPFVALDRIEEVADGIAFYKGFVNLAVAKTGAGCVLIDTGSFLPAAQARQFQAVRAWTHEPLHTAVYTHGHADHAYGLPPFLAEAEERGWTRPEIVAHEAVPPRMQRYIETAGYNGIINSRQFGAPIQWPTNPIYPTSTYARRFDVTVGERRFCLRHARGETDDHTWVHVPDAGVLYTGDLFIWASPNAGNPQKVQRYARDWAEALREMAALDAEVLLPGHGLPIFGAARVRTALSETAEYLDHIHQTTIDGLNTGATVYDIVASLEVPERLRDRPYLLPVYDEPEFIARNVVRCYGGWYSGIPSELKPAHPTLQAREIARLAGGVTVLSERARALLAQGDLRLASHLADWAVAAAPDDPDVHGVRAEVYEARVQAEPSTMSKGIFGDAARTSRAKARPR